MTIIEPSPVPKGSWLSILRLYLAYVAFGNMLWEAAHLPEAGYGAPLLGLAWDARRNFRKSYFSIA
jgi:hypothetical protein